MRNLEKPLGSDDAVHCRPGPAVDTLSMNKTSKISFAALAIALAGCAPLAVQHHLSASNPGSPDAMEALYPMAVPVLMAGTNYAMAPEAEGEEMHHHEESSPQKRPAPSTQNPHHDHNPK